MPDGSKHFDGGCTCGHVRYRMSSGPLIVHGCHCTWCQRQSGTAFATNAIIEADRVSLLQGEVEEMMIPSPGGKGQLMARCPKCRVTVWSQYYFGGYRKYFKFIRAGTLDDPTAMPPDVHIFTSTKQPWVILPPEHKVVEEYYVTEETWSPESLERRAALVKVAVRDKE